ncbi:MAG: zf-HC2 domain-containing protein [Acidimicrobiia bacterium]|nr:zf-HC2 domain-containing protein [Acidimicrobiia bacterium]MDH4309999.1 zf-HC2 domain-containing protein [Acidimicrobiia bacterium]MDH5294484.1 zf-HC2 domain-containing protein [Acidimicrobiia bacterium]
MSDEHCDEALARLYPYLDGELDDAVVAERIRVHLVDCPPCGGAFSFEERLRVVVRSHLREDVPADVLDRLRGVIQRESLGS